MTDEKLVSWKTWKAGISNNDKNNKSFTENIDTNSLEDNVSIESNSITLYKENFNTETNHTLNDENSGKNTTVKRLATFIDISRKIKKPISITELKNRNENEKISKTMSTSLCVYNKANLNVVNDENPNLRHSYTILKNTQNKDDLDGDYDNNWKTKYRTPILNRSNTILNTKTEKRVKNKLNQSLNIDSDYLKEENSNYLSFTDLVKTKNSIKSKTEIDYNKKCTDVQQLLSGIFFFAFTIA